MITRETIDGRPAVVAYINDDFEPMSPEEATMVKIIFDDGEVRFGTKAATSEDDEMDARRKSQWESTKRRSMQLLNQKLFDESKHPRDPKTGECSETGGSGGDEARRPGEDDMTFAKRVIDKRPTPKELPEKHEDYFKMEGATVMPLDKLVSSKSDEENRKGGTNGAKRMAAAANGEIAKRAPINVEPITSGPDAGKFLITDGNGTYTSVKDYGWKAIPVQVDPVGTGEVREAEKAAAKAAKANYKPKPPGLKAEATTMDKVRKDWIAESPIRTMDDVKREAPKAQATLGKVGSAIAAKLGVQYMHPTAKTQKKDKATGEIVENPDGVARIMQKIADKEAITKTKIPLARITDATRGTFVLNSPSDARKVIDELSKSYEMIDEGWRTIPETHYTDRPLLFRDPASGLIGEIQLSHPDLLRAKDHGGGHEMYEEARKLPDGNARKDELNAQMQRLYGAVLNKLPTEWKVIDGRRGYKDRH